jgi:hypothetical protein
LPLVFGIAGFSDSRLLVMTALRIVDFFAAHYVGCIARELAPDFIVVAVEFFELRMMAEVARIVHQVGIDLEFMPNLRMVTQELVEGLFTSECKRRRMPRKSD